MLELLLEILHDRERWGLVVVAILLLGGLVLLERIF